MSNTVARSCVGAAIRACRSARPRDLQTYGFRSREARRRFGNAPPRAQTGLAYKTKDEQSTAAPDPLEAVKQLDLHPLWLRDICSCEHCVDPSSGQKKFWTVDIPPDVQVKACTTNRKGELEYTWHNDVPGLPADHVTTLRPQVILDALSGPASLASLDQVAWSTSTLDLLEVDYEAYTSDPSVFRAALVALQRYGLFFVRNVPESEQSVISIAERIGPLKNTFYGNTWDVRSVPQAKNVAYTSGHLGFHQDLLYMRDPPRLQFLHCIRSSARGGASLFSDGFRAALDVKERDEKAFDDLCTLETRFHYIKDGKHYAQSRPMVEFSPPSGASDPVQGLKAINWSPPFQGPFTSDILGRDTSRIKRWHDAARAFRDASEATQNVYERLMKPGECVVFDNQRVLHARTAFEPGDAGVERWLKGCYTDSDPLWSAWRVMARQ